MQRAGRRKHSASNHAPYATVAGLAPIYAPTLVKALEGKGVASVRSGQHHTLAITGEGEPGGDNSDGC